MRMLNKNKQRLWLIEKIGDIKEVDQDGFYTGEIIPTYSDSPVEIWINIYPYNNEIHGEMFGKVSSLDMVGVTNEININKDSLLFINEPIDNFDKVYDYSIESIKRSLNTTQYGLKRRI